MQKYGNSVAERQRRRNDWQHAPKQCFHCGEPINQEEFNPYSDDEPRYHCGETNCRSAAYRQRKADDLQAARTAARKRIDDYAADLPRAQAAAVLAMRDQLMSTDQKEGHTLALSIIAVIDARACKHDRIATLEQNALLWQRRAEATERQLNDRIKELQDELELFSTLHNTIHRIATQQQDIQPDDPQDQPAHDEPSPQELDRVQGLATLAQAGIKPYTGQQDDEATESGEYDDDEEEK